MSKGTAKVHVERIIRKLDVSDRTQSAVRAIELGFAARSGFAFAFNTFQPSACTCQHAQALAFARRHALGLLGPRFQQVVRGRRHGRRTLLPPAAVGGARQGEAATTKSRQACEAGAC
jgi:hypothetical protein